MRSLTDSPVKSGLLNSSTSKLLPHGKLSMYVVALLTIVSYLALISLFTIAVKPSVQPYQYLLVTAKGGLTFPFSTGAIGIDVILDEADVAFYDWTNIFDPETGSFDVIFY
jgi:hypothetical protein